MNQFIIYKITNPKLKICRQVIGNIKNNFLYFRQLFYNEIWMFNFLTMNNYLGS